MAAPINIDGMNGDLEIRDTKGDVSLDMRHGDAKISDTKGDVKVSGHGGSIEVVNASGGLTINGEVVGPLRAPQVAKGVALFLPRTQFTPTQVSCPLQARFGHLPV